MTRKFQLGFLIGAIALSFLLYGNSLKGGFVYDDQLYSERPELRQPEALIKIWSQPYLPLHRDAGLYRPLASFSFALNFIIFGESTLSFHVINVILNGMVIFLLYLLVLKLFSDRKLALFSALLFAFFPIHTEAVAFIKSRDEILATLFMTGAWLVFLKGTQGKAMAYGRLFVSSILFLLAVFSKELIIVTPLMFLLIDWQKHQRKISEVIKLSLAYLLTALGYLLVRYSVLKEYAFGRDDAYFIINPLGNVDYLARLATAFKIAAIYVGKTFMPINLSATYHYNTISLITNPFSSGLAVLGIIFLGGMIFLAIYRKTRLTALGIGSVSFMVSYLVISKFVFKAGDLLAERWLYFPSLGLSIIGGYLVGRLDLYQKNLARILLAAVLISYALILIPRNKVWADNLSLYQSMIKTAPQSIQGHVNLASYYLENGKIEEARREVEIAFGIYKEHPPLLNLIGAIAYKDDNYDLAETAFLKAIELRPKLPLSYSNVAKVYYKTGHYDKAEASLRNVVNLYPKPEDAILYGLTLAKLKRYDESIEVIKKHFSGNLDNSQIRFVMAVNYFKLRNLGEARKYFDWNKSKSEAEKIEILKDF